VESGASTLARGIAHGVRHPSGRNFYGVLGVSGRISVIALQTERAGAGVGEGKEKIRSAEEVFRGGVDAATVARNDPPSHPFVGRDHSAVTVEMSDPGRWIWPCFDRRFDDHAATVHGTGRTT
jgi:hypothetical protein